MFMSLSKYSSFSKLTSKRQITYGAMLENISSALGFFNPGLTSASFQFSGKQPDCRDRFVILVRIGIRTSKHSTTRGQSVSQDFKSGRPK